MGGLFVTGWTDTSRGSALGLVWLTPLVIDTVQDGFIDSSDITFHAPTRIHLHVGVLDYFPFCHQPTYQPEGHRVEPDGESQLRPRSVETELRLCRRASYRIPSRQPDGHRVKPDGRKPASPSLGWDRAQSMPTGFSPNPVSPTRRPSCQTRWKKTNPKFQNHRRIYTIYDIYILIIGIIYIIYKYKYAL